MKPIMILAAIAGGVLGAFVFQAFHAGLVVTPHREVTFQY
ncbi:MAG: hypothetical protein K0R55_2025 [Sporomusa sp.]|jgi:mannitol-specific phosphotransferase system IIBC component|nr:hypothetical protein [Sporomusa sp.]